MKPAVKLLTIGSVAAALAALNRGTRRTADPAHAPAHRHLGPPADDGGGSAGPTADRAVAEQDQPWIRRSHTDSQRRRFRRGR
ncbi:MAG: hypothetical protein OEY23_23450 [Acidimicrobiia bacterium]|nr:hypothetical protein [Acidimicrobiia bacterium]